MAISWVILNGIDVSGGAVMFIIKKPTSASSPDRSAAPSKAEAKPELKESAFEALDVVSLDHVSHKKPSGSDAQVFPTSPQLSKRSVIGRLLAGSVVTDLRNRNLTSEKLRDFLGGGSGLTLDSVSHALSAYNKNYGGQSDLAGSFLLDKKGTPIGISIGFDGSKQTAEARFCYNLAGNLEVRLNSRIHQGVSENMTVSWFNKSLNKEQVAKIESLARAVENDHFYSTLAVPLAYCRYNRLSAIRDEPVDFAKSHAYFSSHAAEVTSAYKGGACFTLAELLRDKIRQQTGAEAYVVSRFEDNLVANWPKLDGQGTEPN
jgi:hypothetical protein